MPCGNVTALYRFYDAAGQLLYAGITDDPPRRFGDHRRGKTWWPMVARTAVEYFPDRVTALRAELRAIRDEQPRYNTCHRQPAASSWRISRAWHDGQRDRANGRRPVARLGWRPILRDAYRSGWRGEPIGADDANPCGEPGRCAACEVSSG